MKPTESTKDVEEKKEKKHFLKSVVGDISHHKMFTLVGSALVLVISIIIWTITSESNVIVARGSPSVISCPSNGKYYGTI